jgi:hypothetical protein
LRLSLTSEWNNITPQGANMKQYTLAPAIVVILATCVASAQGPATITCPQQGEWDVLSVMMMQPSFTSAHYHLEGTTTTWNYSTNPPTTSSSKNFVYTNWQVTDSQNNKGRVYYIKDYQGLPPNNNTNTGPYYGYPWDVRTYDANYIYFWITENKWADPWSYKEALGSHVMTARCLFPGGQYSTFWSTPMGTSAHTTRYIIQPDPDPQPYSSQDCSKPSTNHDLLYAQTQVNSTYGGFVLNDDIHGGTIDLTILPVIYTWGCTDQTLNHCSNKEEFEFGVDASGNHYGWVQWEHWKNSNFNTSNPTNWVKQAVSVHDHLALDNLTKHFDGTPYFPCTPQ